MMKSHIKKSEIVLKLASRLLTFIFNSKWHSSVKNVIFEKIVFVCDVIMTSLNNYDTHPGMVINRTKFRICTPCSFGGVKVHVYKLI